MASLRTAQWLDAQNFTYELNTKQRELYSEMKKHEAENGKDAQYYTLLGMCQGVADALRMADEFIAGKYRTSY